MKNNFKLAGLLLLMIFSLQKAQAESYYQKMLKNTDCILKVADNFEHSYDKKTVSEEVSQITMTYSLKSSLLAKLRMKNGSEEITKFQASTQRVKNEMILTNVVPVTGPIIGTSIWEQMENDTEQSILSLASVIGYCNQ